MGNPFASDCSTALELVRDDFGTGAPIARVFMPGYVFVALCGPQLNLLTMTGNKRAAAGTMMVGAAIGVIGCVIGIQIYGPLGAAIGLALAPVVWNVAMAVYIRKRLKTLPGLVYALLTLLNMRAVKSRHGIGSYPDPDRLQAVTVISSRAFYSESVVNLQSRSGGAELMQTHDDLARSDKHYRYALDRPLSVTLKPWDQAFGQGQRVLYGEEGQWKWLATPTHRAWHHSTFCD